MKVDCHAVQAPLAMTEKQTHKHQKWILAKTSKATIVTQQLGGRIFDEKAGLRRLLRGDKTDGLSHKQKASSLLYRKKPTPKTRKEKK